MTNHANNEAKRTDLSDAVLIEAFDFFSGAVPPGPVFQLETDDLITIVRSRTSESLWTGVSRLAIIGLVASFEAFCKDLFAATINIDPTLVRELKSAKFDISVDLTSLLILDVPTPHCFGFFLGERLKLNEPKKVNAAFFSSLGVSPLAKDDMKYLARLLEERHLLVHHGGMITSRYHASKLRRREISDRLHVDSLEITEDEIGAHIHQLRKLAHKMLKTVASAMRKRSNLSGSTYYPVQLEGVAMLEWWEPDDASDSPGVVE
ncbi:MAG: hypothetical protein NCW75_05160 [Phycisphaera sp.]|nr:MAG: hypothetical protein NCW75_05160 [Phycisphaera sp.]